MNTLNSRYSWNPQEAAAMRKRTAWHTCAASLLGGRSAGYATPMAIIKALQQSAAISNMNFLTITPQDHLGVLAILTDTTLQSAARTEFQRLFAADLRKVD